MGEFDNSLFSVHRSQNQMQNIRLEKALLFCQPTWFYESLSGVFFSNENIRQCEHMPIMEEINCANAN